MVTISSKEARKNPIYRDIMAAAIWQWRRINREHPAFFELSEDSPRYRSFSSSAYGMIVDFPEYDSHTGKLYVDVIFQEAPRRRRIMIWE